MGASPPRRDVLHDLAAEKHQGDAIAILQSRVREYRGKLAGKVDLATVHRAEVHRRGKVDGQQDGEIALFDELFDVRSAAPRRDVPVDEPDVITRLVFAHLRKLDPAPVKCGVILTRKSDPD
jgi:hypothetical protein